MTFAIALFAATVGVASAAESQPLLAPSSSLIVETAWDEEIPPAGESAPAEEVPLEERVKALEEYIQEMETAQEKQAAEEAPADLSEECKPEQIDIISKPVVQLRGRIFVDGISYDDDDDTADFFNRDRENEFGFDTFRLGASGHVYENMPFYLEVEFEGTETDFKDVYIEMIGLPHVGTIRAGHFKEPIGLEELTSDTYTTFMERSPANQTFAPARSYGVMLYNHLDACQDATWFTGIFRNDSDDSPNAIATQRDDRNDWSYSSRLAWVPYYDEPSEGRYLVHLGASYSYRNASDFLGNGNGLAEFGTGAYVGNQGPIGVGAEADSDEWNLIGLEFAAVWGATSFQAEYFHDFVTSGEQYNGAYALVSYFLTGEHRTYRKDRKAFDRVTPFEPAFWIDTCKGACCGRGAWEAAAGYSYVDLEDGHDITPGTLERAFVNGPVVGINWYLNSNARMMFDYYHEITDFVDDDTPDSNANIFGARWQVDW